MIRLFLAVYDEHQNVIEGSAQDLLFYPDGQYLINEPYVMVVHRSVQVDYAGICSDGTFLAPHIMPLNNPVSVIAGDSLRFAEGALKVVASTLFLKLGHSGAAFEAWKSEAKEEDIWEAAFLAGSMTTYKLLTGEDA